MRKRLGDDTFDEFSKIIMRMAHPDINEQVDSNKVYCIKTPKRKIENRCHSSRSVHYLPPTTLDWVNDARIKTEKNNRLAL